MNVKLVVVEVDVGKQFTNKQEFVIREHVLQWIHTEDAKLGFSVVIGRIDDGFDKRHAFVTMRCKKNDKYTKPI